MALLHLKTNVWIFCIIHKVFKVPFLLVAALFLLSIWVSIYGKNNNLHDWFSDFSIHENYLEGLEKRLLAFP